MIFNDIPGDNSPPVTSPQTPIQHLGVPPNPFIPKEAYLFFPTPQDCFKPHPAKTLKTYRYIFQGSTPLLPHELSKISAAKALSPIFDADPNFWSPGFTYRFLQNKDSTIQQDVTGMEEHYSWRQSLSTNHSENPNYANNLKSIKANLTKGYVYLAGRDCCFRPYIVTQTKLIKESNLDLQELAELYQFFLDFIVDNLLLDGQVECWNVIFDLQDLGVFSLPYKLLQGIAKFLQSNYRGRVFRIYFLNAPWAVKTAWNVCKGFLEETTRDKIEFSGGKDCKEMWVLTNRGQLEVRFGGLAENKGFGGDGFGGCGQGYWPYVPLKDEHFWVGDGVNPRVISVEEYKDKLGLGVLGKHRVMPIDFLVE